MWAGASIESSPYPLASWPRRPPRVASAEPKQFSRYSEERLLRQPKDWLPDDSGPFATRYSVIITPGGMPI